MPRNSVISLALVVFGGLADGCTCARPPAENAPAVARASEPLRAAADAGDTVHGDAHGMWVWGTKGRLANANAGGIASLVETCRLAGLNEVYLSSNDGVLDDPRLPELMTALRDAHVRVEALMGEAAWYREDQRAPMLARIEAVAAYDEGHPSARFAGVHLDIEPHQIPAYRGDHRFLPELAAAIRDASALAARRGLSASVDLPRFALDEDGPAFARSGARPFVMLYQLRDPSAEWLVTQSGKVLDHTYAGVSDDAPGRTVIGLRVDDYPMDLEKMVAALDRAHGSRARYGGWAIHDEAKYRARAPGK